MKSINLYLYILCSAFLLGGCRNQNDEIKDNLLIMKSKSVKIPFTDMSCWINDSIMNNRPWERAKMKLIVYMDSISCVESTMSYMSFWDDYVQLENKYEDMFYIFFIMKSEQLDVRMLSSYFHYTGLNHPIYIDSTNVFMKYNPHIPSKDKYHTFLLDEDNNVILVGNPLYNSRIGNMLEKTIEGKMRRVCFHKQG